MREKGCPAEKGENEQCKIPRAVRCPHLTAKEGGVAESGSCHLRGIDLICVYPCSSVVKSVCCPREEDAQFYILSQRLLRDDRRGEARA